MRDIWDRLAARWGGMDAIDLSRDLIEALSCPSCKTDRPLHKAAESVLEDEVRCPDCNAECVPRYFHSMSAESPLLDLTPAQIGLPRWDVVWGRFGEQMVGVEMTGDRDECLILQAPAI